MNLLKQLPITYKGELHEIRLINFSVDPEEIFPLLPNGIKPRIINGRSIISMVDVLLKKMKPAVFPVINFSYQHIAFRLLIDDRIYNDGIYKGIYFLKSFTEKNIIKAAGNLFTQYNFEKAHITNNGKETYLCTGNGHIIYRLNHRNNEPCVSTDLKNIISSIDRAYFRENGKTFVTKILREKWPLKETSCELFENTFFKSSRFEEAFIVEEPIHYTWIHPNQINK